MLMDVSMANVWIQATTTHVTRVDIVASTCIARSGDEADIKLIYRWRRGSQMGRSAPPLQVKTRHAVNGWGTFVSVPSLFDGGCLSVAQWIERRPKELGVAGSNPAGDRGPVSGCARWQIDGKSPS